MIDAIRDDDGNILGFAKITRDISERREAQQNLEKIQRQLAESQKLDALGQLTGGVAHDFNNLLMIITGNIHILKRLAGNDAKGLRAVQAIEKASQHGASLTRQLLTFARRQSVSPQTIDLSERIHSLRDVLDTGLGGAVQILIHIDADVWPVTVDPGEFEAALVNLVVNARDAMAGGGTVTIRASNTRLDDDATDRRFRRHSGRGFRHRHPTRCRRQGVRSVLHDQAGRQGDGSRPFTGAWFRASGRGHGDGGKASSEKARF